ncbi:MAG: tRNA-dihydrouridine synthase family protein [Bacteriovorax sp.]|nr:tRNA-dihydrouridine synthase family protein [Bacteriovorax sp.]
MNNFDVFPKKSLLFAPMEGITDEAYRIALMKTFPEWDQFFTDFLRVPTVGKITEKMIVEHYGERILAREDWRQKNSFQILTTPRAQTQAVVEILESLKMDHLDLNLGCPSKKVNSHLGGAYLLSNHDDLRKVLRTIRTNFTGHFTVKMRIGYRNDSNFSDSLRLIQDEGVEAITLHARTRDQLYKGVADWSYIKKAVEEVKIPLIGNGDVWIAEDIEKLFHDTKCHSVMFGRSALKTPWLAKIYKDYVEDGGHIDDTYLLYQRKQYLELYFEALMKEYREIGWAENLILKRFKSFSRNLYDDYENFEAIRGSFLRSESLTEYLDHLYALKG